MVILGQEQHLYSTVQASPAVEQMVVDESTSGDAVGTTDVYGQGIKDEEGYNFYYYVPLNPVPSDLYGAIIEAVCLEVKYQPALTLPPVPKDQCEITSRMRNGSCHVLRCLRVWYELPSDAFFLAVNLMDRFLTRMRAQPKHLSCIAVAAFSLGAYEVTKRNGIKNPSKESICVISQSKCTENDMSRMEEIMRRKLNLEETPYYNGLPVTPLDLLKLLHEAYSQLLRSRYPSMSAPTLLPLIYKLEMVMCDAGLANHRPSLLALALLKTHLSNEIPDDVYQNCVMPLVNACKISEECLAPIEALVMSALTDYYGSAGSDEQSPRDEHNYYRQRLVWKLSNRTLRQLKPTAKLRRKMRLSSIEEFPVEELLEEESEEKMETEESEKGMEEMQEDVTSDSCVCMDQSKESQDCDLQNCLEESYCQVAKKLRQEASKNMNRSVSKMPSFSPPPYSNTVMLQSSPMSKIILTSQLPRTSPESNLSRVLFDDSDNMSEDEDYTENTRFYAYHHAQHVGVLEGLDGVITTAQLFKQKLGGKRRKPKVKVGLFTEIRFGKKTDSLSTESSNMSSEEDMEDSDYEKDFPPLPLPRSPLFSYFIRSPQNSFFMNSSFRNKLPKSLPQNLADIAVAAEQAKEANKSYSFMAVCGPKTTRTSSRDFPAASKVSSKNKKTKSPNTSNKKSKNSLPDSTNPYYVQSPARKKNIKNRAIKTIHFH